jgi:HAMP domain-containing protein
MPDYSLISDSDLIALKKGDYSSISTEGLLELKRQSTPPTPTIGEMRRREEQGMVSVLPPEQVQTQVNEYAGQLQEAVDQSNKIASATAAARAGGGGFISPPLGTPETQKEVLAGGVRYGTGPALQTIGVPLPIGQAIGETGYQLMTGETEPRKIAAAATKEAVTSLGGGAAKFLPAPIRRNLFETGQTLLSAAAKVPIQGAMRGIAGEAARTAVAGENWDENALNNILESARDYAVGETAGSFLGNVIGAGYRKYTGGTGSFLGELNRPFYDQFQKNITEKEGELVGKLSRTYRADENQVKDVLAESFKRNSTKSGQDFSNAVVSDVEKLFGKLDDETTTAFSKLANDYDKIETLTLGDAAGAVKNVAKGVYKRKQDVFSKEFDAFREDARFKAKDYDKAPAKGQDLYGPQDPVTGKSLNDLWKEQQDAAKAIKWGEPVKPGTGDQFAAYQTAKEKFETAIGQFEKKYPNDPLPKEFNDLKGRFKGFMEDYNTTFSKGILKNIGEQGGTWSSIITSLGGSDGPAKLQQLKKILAEDYDAVKSTIGYRIYNDLNVGGQTKYLENLENVLYKATKGVQKEVLDEFFPGITQEGIKQARAALEVSSKGFAEDFRKAAYGKGESVIATPAVVLEFLNNSKENVTKVRSALSAETLADTQNALLAQIVSEASKKGPITSKSFINSAGSWQNALDGVFGPSGKTKIDEISKALDIAEKNKTSLISKLLPGIAGTAAFAKGTTAAGPFFGIAGSERAYNWTEKLQSKLAGYLLDNPNYRAAVIKPFDQLTNAETRMLDNDIPMIIRNLTVKTVMAGE